MDRAKPNDPFASKNPDGSTIASSQPLIDHARVEEVIDLICEGEPAAFDRWIAYLESDLAKFAALLPGAGSTESIRGIQSSAHSLKGTCLNLGAPVLGTLFAELERYAKEGNSTALNSRYAHGRELEVQTIQALRELAAKLPLPGKGS